MLVPGRWGAVCGLLLHHDNRKVSMSFRSREDTNFCRSCVLRLSTGFVRFISSKRSDEWSNAQSRYRSSRELEASEENQYTIPNLTQRAKDGCGLCSLILRAFTKEEASLTNWFYEFQQSDINRDEHHHSTSRQLHQPEQFKLHFNWSLGRKTALNRDVKTKRVTITLIEVKKPRNTLPMATIRSRLYSDWRTELLRSTSSAASMDQVRIWIEECKDSHECYKVQRANTFFPTRLVELVKGFDKFRLCDSDQLPSETRYATLSHCWGNVPFCRLLQENISAFMDNIPFSILPQTFQDAVTVLEKLCIKYLWIDSLCIIQDSTADWNAEAATMSKVYANSYLNLSATASRNSQEGLFRTREPSNVKSCRFIPHEHGRAKDLIDSYKTHPGWDCVNLGDWVTAIVDAPLISRAWVYQERELAPRILHFSSSELFWECNHMRASEMFPDGLPKQYVIPKQKNLFYSHSRQKKVTVSNQQETIVEATSLGRFLDAFINKSEASPLDLWTLVVEDYSSAQLTYATDKLVAISALAQIFAQYYNDSYLRKKIESSVLTYLAGLWSHQLLEQLLWRIKSYFSTTTLGPSPYIAPSWSWASVTSPINYSPIRKPRRNLSPLSKLLSASTTPSSTPFGAVTAGSIKILGPLFEARLEPKTYPEEYGRYSPHLRVGSCRDNFYCSLDDERDIAQSEIFCLPLFLSPFSPSQISSSLEIEGLLLVSTLPEIYRRVGIFSSSVMYYETLFQEIREAQKGECFKKSAGRIVALKELWRDVRRFVRGVEYEKVEVQVLKVEIV
jgi:Heterokaryon incompatibility protein (HET)